MSPHFVDFMYLFSKQFLLRLRFLAYLCVVMQCSVTTNLRVAWYYKICQLIPKIFSERYKQCVWESLMTFVSCKASWAPLPKFFSLDQNRTWVLNIFWVDELKENLIHCYCIVAFPSISPHFWKSSFNSNKVVVY